MISFAIPVQCSTIVIFTSSSVVHIYVLYVNIQESFIAQRRSRSLIGHRINCNVVGWHIHSKN